jgi:hypothetical protein
LAQGNTEIHFVNIRNRASVRGEGALIRRGRKVGGGKKNVLLDTLGKLVEASAVHLNAQQVLKVGNRALDLGVGGAGELTGEPLEVGVHIRGGEVASVAETEEIFESANK